MKCATFIRWLALFGKAGKYIDDWACGRVDVAVFVAFAVVPIGRRMGFVIDLGSGSGFGFGFGGGDGGGGSSTTSIDDNYDGWCSHGWTCPWCGACLNFAPLPPPHW